MARWREPELKERTTSQSHLTDPRRNLGESTSTDAGPRGEWQTCEPGAGKDTLGGGWAGTVRQGDRAPLGICKVIVVGAGAAGLAATHTLRKRGAHVTLLGASDCAGGRMTGEIVNGFHIDTGAQLASRGDTAAHAIV